MNFSISDLSSILKLATSSPNEAKALIKLLSIDVTKDLGGNNYLIQTPTKQLTASSQQALTEGAKYWAQLSTKPDTTPQLSQLIKMPKLLQELQNIPVKFDIKEFHEILTDKKPLQTIKDNLLDHLAQSTSKEEFTQVSNLLLSLMQNTLTIPLEYERHLSFFQVKKRYNKNQKKSQLDFYAALSTLGPIAGTIMLLEDEVRIDLNLAFETTKQFLEENIQALRYKVHLHVRDNIEPLYNFDKQTILDINV